MPRIQRSALAFALGLLVCQAALVLPFVIRPAVDYSGASGGGSPPTTKVLDSTRDFKKSEGGGRAAKRILVVALSALAKTVAAALGAWMIGHLLP
jgi:hypothetical protein